MGEIAFVMVHPRDSVTALDGDGIDSVQGLEVMYVG